MVTGFFFRTGPGNQFIYTRQSRVTGNWVSFRLIIRTYRAKIEGSQPLPMEISVEKPGLNLEEDKEEAEEGDNGEDVPAELAKSVVIGEKLPVLPPGYSISEGRLAYNEEWNEIVDLQSDSEEEWYDF